MGVNGLWTLLNPVARPVALETLEKKRLAVDASIWIYQFQMATRDKKTGNVIQGAHIMGTFRRIMKLLFHGIRPVFVFDGDAPALKKRTLEGRRRRKEGAGQSLQRTAKALLSAQLRAHLAEQETKRSRAARPKKDAAAADRADEGTGDQIGESAVYLEDLEPEDEGAPPRPRRRTSTPAARETPPGTTDTTSPKKKYVPRDAYALPAIEGPLENRAKQTDARIATAQEERDFFEEMRPDFFDSEEFAGLSTQLKYEIIGEQRLKSRQVNHRRVQQMKLLPTPLDFSQSQIANLMERNQYTQKLLEVTDELGRAKIQIPTRVAGERGRVYELIKQDPSKGTGYVLGVRNPVLNSTEPITIESTTDDSTDETDSDEFEEVAVEKERRSSPPPVDPELRRAAALEAIRARLGPLPEPDYDPYLDGPARGPEDLSMSLFLDQDGFPAVGHADDNPDPELQEALLESALLAKISEAVQERESRNDAEKRQTAESTAGGDSDDELEYVDVARPKASTSSDPAPNSAKPGRQGPVVSSSRHIELVDLSDSDDSDDFEEVAVQPAASPAPAAQPVVASPAPLPRPSPPPAPAANQSAPARRSLMDSVLISDDSDSETDSGTPAQVTTNTTKGIEPPTQPTRRISSPALPKVSRFERSLRVRSPSPVQRSPSPLPELAPVTKTTPAASQDEGDDSNQRQSASSAPAPIVARDFVADKSPSPFEPASNGVDSEPSLDIVGSITGAGAISVPETKETVIDTLEDAQRAPSPPPTLPSTLAPEFSPTPKPASKRPRQSSPEPAAPLLHPVADQLAHGRMSPSELLPENKDWDAKLPPLPALPTASEKAIESAANDSSASTVAHPGPDANDAGGDEEEEVFFDDWEKSPTPPPRQRGAGLFRENDADEDGFARDEEEPDYEAEEEEEMMRNYEREEKQYADMLSQLKNRKIEDMVKEAQGDVNKLMAQRNAEQRNADGITRTMTADIQEMLMLFGIPFIIAPQEAEAECAELLARDLVDGIVTDDSDVFLFGGHRVYRHMFNDNKVVECYLMGDLDRELGLDRHKLVQLAYLLGGDYADGLRGVGPVVGRELLAEFDGPNGLQDFKAWWRKVQEGRDDKGDTDTAFKRRFKKGQKKLVLDESWPNPEIAKAYYKPVVTDSNEAFDWGSVDLDGLRMFLNRTLTWTHEKVTDLMLPLIRRQQARANGTLKQQAFLSDYFDVSAGSGPRKGRAGYENKRLQNILKAHRRARGEEVSPAPQDEGDSADKADHASSDEELPPPVKRARPTPRRKSTTGSASSSSKGKGKAKAARNAANDFEDGLGRLGPKKTTAASRRKAKQAQREARAAQRGGDFSSEEDLGGPSRPTIASNPRPKRGATKRPAREVFSSSDEEGGSTEKRAKQADAAV